MVIDQLNLIKKQSETMLRNKISGSTAKLRAETSLVKQASRMTGRINLEMKQAEQVVLHAGRSGKHRVEPETVAEKPRAVKPAPDGYVRRSAHSGAEGLPPADRAPDSDRRIGCALHTGGSLAAAEVRIAGLLRNSPVPYR